MKGEEEVAATAASAGRDVIVHLDAPLRWPGKGRRWRWKEGGGGGGGGGDAEGVDGRRDGNLLMGDGFKCAEGRGER